MKTPILDILNDFSFELQKLSSNSLRDLEIILPIEQYKQFEYEISGRLFYDIPKDGKYNLQNINGIDIKITCKELNNALIRRKLERCFKILSE